MAAPVTLVGPVIDYVTAALKAGMPEEVTVKDGPPTQGDLANDYVAIAYAEDEDASAVEGSRVDADWGNGLKEETFNVRCQISSFIGDQDDTTLKERRDRVTQLYGILLSVVEGDSTLGGLVVGYGRAYVTEFSWRQEPYEDGTQVAAVFDIVVNRAVLAP